MLNVVVGKCEWVEVAVEEKRTESKSTRSPKQKSMQTRTGSRAETVR